MLSEVDLMLYEKGVCYVKPWCSDSKRLALQLQGTPLQITFVDYNDDKVYQFVDAFVDTNMEAKPKNLEVDNHFLYHNSTYTIGQQKNTTDRGPRTMVVALRS